MKLILALLTAGLIAVPFNTTQAAEMTEIANMPAGAYELDRSHASLVLKVSHIGLANYTFRFNEFSADLTLDPKNIESSAVEVSINPMSIDTGSPFKDKKDFDAKLATSEDWLNAGEFPKIAFKSKKLEKTGENTGQMTGDLTLLGVTKPVTLDVVFNGAYESKPFADVAALGFSASGSLNRSDWQFNTYIPSIGDKIDIIIEAEFHKKPDATPEASAEE
jgi:polyisoprenoid-binding protein YceI